MNVRKFIIYSVAVATLTTTPAAAWAANVSSADGFGNQFVSKWLGNGAMMDGHLKSTSGAPVHMQGTVCGNWWRGCSD